ncbi:anti-sigma factor [Nitratireductor sp. CAU 1489]|uniref:Anti-sigma factor n=1 Tax=Nitratireductor arenosus TaxID=2682096 RepID=A0A844QJU9_9HYPH|nr:anti-sigma factor [Nitratireductor arenosus]MVA98308.1 anti-sigma factor [Nitratireductor arenosus]
MSAADDNGRELTGDDALAADYVLGALDGDHRRTAARRIETDPGFARLVERWEEHLAPLAAGYEPVEPPAVIKTGLDARLFAAGNGTPMPREVAAPAGGFWQSLAVWRGIAVAAIAALILALIVPLLAPPPADEPTGRLVASLAPQQSNVHYFVVYDASTRDIGLSHVTGERDAGRDFELWVIEGDTAPASLGVIPAGSTVHLAVGAELRRKIEAGAVFAISLEPAGGSPTGQPTGPVVAAGDLREI